MRHRRKYLQHNRKFFVFLQFCLISTVLSICSCLLAFCALVKLCALLPSRFFRWIVGEAEDVPTTQGTQSEAQKTQP